VPRIVLVRVNPDRRPELRGRGVGRRLSLQTPLLELASSNSVGDPKGNCEPTQALPF